MEFSDVVFYGRSGRDALKMFHLSVDDLVGARVLDCPGGPGSLAATLRAKGIDVVSVDPLYALDDQAIKQRALKDLDDCMKQLERDPAIRAGFDLETCRLDHDEALETFLSDRSMHPEHYLAASLPSLPFPDLSFDVVLSGHLLFIYSSRAEGGLMPGSGLDLDWHRQALQELLRVSRRSVRLFPAHTIEPEAKRHPYVDRLVAVT